MLETTVRNAQVLYLQENLSLEAKHEQLAEESCELAQAALKLIRAYGNGNPTPISYSDAFENLMEEVADVLLCLEILDLYPGTQRLDAKLGRWYNRVKEAQDV